MYESNQERNRGGREISLAFLPISSSTPPQRSNGQTPRFGYGETTYAGHFIGLGPNWSK